MQEEQHNPSHSSQRPAKPKKVKKVKPQGPAAVAQHAPAVQRTNDESIVSKRSAGKLDYVTDPYIQHFVKKVARRTPLINRGYYLRLKSMYHLVQELLLSMLPAAPRVQVLSLGAGYDTLAARLYEDANYSRVDFFEVDFPAVMRNKRGLIEAEKTHFPFPWDQQPAPPPPAKQPAAAGDPSKGKGKDSNKPRPYEYTIADEIHVPRYHTFGHDLTDLQPLLSKLVGFGFDPNAPTVVYAECVMQYMDAADSTRVVEWVAKALGSAVFIAYDQIGPNDSFGSIMAQSLGGRASPLLGFNGLGCRTHLAQRADKVGLHSIRVADFHRLSQYFLQGAERTRVEAIEVFDEMEDMCEICDHYCILVGETNPTSVLSEGRIAEVLTPYTALKGLPPYSAPPTKAKEEEKALLPVEPVSPQFGFEGWGHVAVFDAVLNGIVIVGGYATAGKHQGTRTNAVLVHRFDSGDCYFKNVVVGSAPAAEGTTDTAASAQDAPQVMFHTMTPLCQSSSSSTSAYLVFGGRQGPTRVSSDAWLLELDSATDIAKWTLLAVSAKDGSPLARFRHGASPVRLEGTTDLPAALVFGGLDGNGGIHTDAWLAQVDLPTATIRWKKLHTAMPPRASAAVTALNSTSVVVAGGLTSTQDTCTADVMLLELKQCSSGDVTLDVRPQPDVHLPHPVFSASAVVPKGSDDTVLIVGGSSFGPRDERGVYSEDIRCLHLTNAETECGEKKVSHLSTLPPREDVRTTWSRCCALSPCNDTLVLIGGGFMCFSFGNFSNKAAVVKLSKSAKSPWSQK